MKAEQGFSDPVRTARHQACELPTQEDPDVEQEQANSEQEKAQGWVARGGRGTHTPHHAVTTFDAEAATIFLVDLVHRPIEADDEEGQPFAAACTGFVRDERGFQRQGRRAAIAEGMSCSITACTPAQGTDASSFAADRASDEAGCCWLVR